MFINVRKVEKTNVWFQLYNAAMFRVLRWVKIE